MAAVGYTPGAMARDSLTRDQPCLLGVSKPSVLVVGFWLPVDLVPGHLGLCLARA